MYKSTQYSKCLLTINIYTYTSIIMHSKILFWKHKYEWFIIDYELQLMNSYPIHQRLERFNSYQHWNSVLTNRDLSVMTITVCRASTDHHNNTDHYSSLDSSLLYVKLWEQMGSWMYKEELCVLCTWHDIQVFKYYKSSWSIQKVSPFNMT